jgi:hypothetical protein
LNSKNTLALALAASFTPITARADRRLRAAPEAR